MSAAPVDLYIDLLARPTHPPGHTARERRATRNADFSPKSHRKKITSLL